MTACACCPCLLSYRDKGKPTAFTSHLWYRHFFVDGAISVHQDSGSSPHGPPSVSSYENVHLFESPIPRAESCSFAFPRYDGFLDNGLEGLFPGVLAGWGWNYASASDDHESQVVEGMAGRKRTKLSAPPDQLLASSAPRAYGSVPCFSAVACESRGTASSVPETSGPTLARGRIEDVSRRKASSAEDVDVSQEGSKGAGAETELDRDMFTRLYHVAGIRIPAAESGILMKTLSRHLLHWPRIQNVVRVPGDSLSNDEAGGVGVSNAHEGVASRRRNAVSFRVVDAKAEESVVGTRLLLLDEKYAKREASELPPAVQDLIAESEDQHKRPRGHLVQCELIVSYTYWGAHEVLQELLPPSVLVPSAFETVGHIAHLNLREEHLPYRHAIAQVILDKNSPKIKSVVNKLSAIHNTFRTMELEVLAGNTSLLTTTIEHGMVYEIDLGLVYWNSRLATERQRLIQQFGSADVVCDVFAGVGPIAVTAAKKVKRVLANDLNPHAVTYLAKNAARNRVAEKVEVFNLDGRDFIRKVLGLEEANSVTQFVMNLPADAAEFLDAFKGAVKKENQIPASLLPMIHVYGFSNSADPEEEFIQRVVKILGEAPGRMDTHRVRLVSPGKWMLCLSFQLPQKFAQEA